LLARSELRRPAVDWPMFLHGAASMVGAVGATERRECQFSLSVDQIRFAGRTAGQAGAVVRRARTFITTVTFERHIMKHSLKFAIVLSVLIAATLPATSHQAQTVTADAALAELKAGNAHHVRHQYQHPHETVARQRELLAAQHPHAEILSCADSRVPPEIVFDQGLGDLFVVRVAGNVATDTEIGSLEYGA